MTEDEQLERALALSMQDSQPKFQLPVAPQEDDDEAQFMADLQRAIEASKAEVSKIQQPERPIPIQSDPPSRSQTHTPFLSDRAQLERERLERQKRLRGEMIDEEKDEIEVEELPPAKRHHPSSSNRPARANGGASSSSTISRSITGTSTPATTGEQLFWDGELRQTANKHADLKQDIPPTFRLTEVIGNKSEIAFALLSSYTTLWGWIYEFFDPSTPVLIVSQPDETGQESVKNILPNWVRTTPFLRSGRGCMHMKFMLLFHKTGRLRVVVSTANFVDFDWRDIENTVWVQDIPLRASPIPHDPKATDFPATFERVLKALNVRSALDIMIRTDHPNIPFKSISDLRRLWDFSKVKVKLVASIAGKHEGWPNVIHTGHTALMKAVRDLGVRAGKEREVIVECQGSSIGTYSTQWMNEFHCSARGESAEEWLDQAKTKRSKLPWPPVKIVFPSLQTVRNSALGEPGGGTMFCRKSQWEAAKFPRELFYDSNSKQGRILMHTKMIIATFRDRGVIGKSNKSSSSAQKGKRRATPSDSDTEYSDDDIVEIDPPQSQHYVGWAYVGSHNFTPSAWGTLSGSSFSPTLNVTNYELGIVFPLKDEKDVDRVAAWKRPPRKYDTRKDIAWMQEESAALRG
ncbi:hypothetical protein JAAARDRAFT_159157 [Jaapia argillacea MUCL 33604]|uniref:PLD phosphodiesterase domain-containing protein n=1 Tax=Jaapia argillacea MUCL 33604 TaxID=933084 RepID=A0A067PPP5_9AGAM|nr:hypothetical protein JAAARDRAFT_159157 [Jaapia argillacea MUCL 33604]